MSRFKWLICFFTSDLVSMKCQYTLAQDEVAACAQRLLGRQTRLFHRTLYQAGNQWSRGTNLQVHKYFLHLDSSYCLPNS